MNETTEEDVVGLICVISSFWEFKITSFGTYAVYTRVKSLPNSVMDLMDISHCWTRLQRLGLETVRFVLRSGVANSFTYLSRCFLSFFLLLDVVNKSGSDGHAS